jgi:hypothetical protein
LPFPSKSLPSTRISSTNARTTFQFKPQVNDPSMSGG